MIRPDYRLNKKRLYFDFAGEIVAPVLGNSLLGILYTFIIWLFKRPKQIIKSAPLPFLLNVHQPTVFFTNFPRFFLRLYNSQIFKSIFSLFQLKSYGVLKDLEGRIAPNFFMNHSSHLTPFWGFPIKILSLGLYFRKFHALLIHKIEQYFLLFFPIGFKQNKHNIFRHYKLKWA